MRTLPLSAVTAALDTLAPLRHAAAWDNVGLLVEPVTGASVAHVHLTIDLTEPVLAEAMGAGADLVVAYHPPIFGGQKRLTQDLAHQRVLLQAIRAGVALYSPHTAADAAAGGVNDWLLDGLGRFSGRRPIEPADEDGEPVAGGVGMGRIGLLDEAAELGALVDRLKAYLGLAHLRVAASARHDGGEPVERVAVCPGAGGSLFEELVGPDLFVTGEMRHHDVLSKVAAGASVILTEHSNCERGWLLTLAERLREATGLRVTVSEIDRDPLAIR